MGSAVAREAWILVARILVRFSRMGFLSRVTISLMLLCVQSHAPVLDRSWHLFYSSFRCSDLSPGPNFSVPQSNGYPSITSPNDPPPQPDDSPPESDDLLNSIVLLLRPMTCSNDSLRHSTATCSAQLSFFVQLHTHDTHTASVAAFEQLFSWRLEAVKSQHLLVMTHTM